MLKVYIDASTKGNPGPSGGGILIVYQGKQEQLSIPDTFGNMGQTPQLMKQAGISAAAFGRGVKPIGFDNQVLEQQMDVGDYIKLANLTIEGTVVSVGIRTLQLKATDGTVL